MAQHGEHDFDFLHGKWRIDHRRLNARLVGSEDWQHFGGDCLCQPTLGGLGNFDDNIIALPGGTYRAMTIRAFDPSSRQWSIWWLDGRAPGQLDVPVVGSFQGDTGTFLAQEIFDGRSVRIRFQWRRGASPVWEQALSADDGQSWEVNWTMHFTRDDSVIL